MKLHDDFDSALRHFRKHKLRTALTVLSMAVSVLSIILLVSVADAMRRDKMQYFEQAGARLSEVVLLDQRGMDQLGTSLERIQSGDQNMNMSMFERLDYKPIKDWRDIEHIKAVCGDTVKAMTPLIQSRNSIAMSAGHLDGSARVYGVTEEFFACIGPKPIAGRAFSREDIDEARRVLIASWSIQREYLACELSQDSEEPDYETLDSMYGPGPAYEQTPRSLIEDDNITFRLDGTEYDVVGLMPSDFPVIEKFFRWNWAMSTLR